MVINEKVRRKVIPIASGKGGVGKTIIAANLSLELALNGKKTVVIDFDLGGSNLHTALGLRNVNPGIGNFLSGRGVKFKSIVIHTPYENLSFIPGDVLVSGAANIQFSQKKKLLANILDLDVDYIILDLGSGCSFQVIDNFLISNSGFVVVTGQTTSILNAYGFFKNLVFHFLHRVFASSKEATRYLKEVLKEKNPNDVPSMKEIMGKMGKKDRSATQKAKKYLSVLRPGLIVNMAQSPDELQMVDELRSLIRDSLSIEVECIGLIYRDPSIDDSLEESKPLMISHPEALAAREISRISQKLIQSEKFPEMPLELDYYADSFELTLIEANNDYEELQTAAGPDDELDMGDLLKIISNQKKKINELQGTLRMLTMKGPGS